MKPIPHPDSVLINTDFIVVDARGHLCPVPTLKLRRKMAEAETETGFILWANDPMAQIDIPHFCNQNNYVLHSMEVKEEAWMFTIIRA